MYRVGPLAVAVVLAAGVLAGCSGGEAEQGADYCSTLADAKEEFSALDQGDVQAFQRFQEVADDLEQQAPQEVAGDWKVVNTSLDELEQKLSSAGITFDDLEGIANGQLPEGVTREDLTQLSEDLQGFGTEELQNANRSIQQHAKAECDIDLEQ